MKNLYLFAIVTAALTMASCDKDDVPGGGGKPGKVDPSKVFVNGMPTKVDEYTIHRGSDGLVSKISYDSGEIVFDYNPSETDYDIIATDIDTKYEPGSVRETYYMKLNSLGFVSYVYQKYSSSRYDEWWFEYNSNGQLNKMKRSEGNETTTMKYSDGNIVETKCTDGNNYTILYPNKIVNKGAVMFFDNTLGIDMDEMDFAYYAGLLGKATKYLPEILVDQEDGYEDHIDWEFNSNGFPIEVDRSIKITW